MDYINYLKEITNEQFIKIIEYIYNKNMIKNFILELLDSIKTHIYYTGLIQIKLKYN